MNVDSTMNQSLNVRVTKPLKRDTKDCEVAIIGAGPYGLSAGAHLKASGVNVRVFGEPMEFWANKMPEGMLLRSPRVASNISDPTRAYTLEAYEAASRIAPQAPLPLDTFVAYGQWFKKQLGSDLDLRNVSLIKEGHQGFTVTLKDGEQIACKRVVVAAGIGPFRYKPEVFKDLDPLLASHCYEGRNIRAFSGKRVAVIGAGQSALESAALLHEAGAEVEIIAKIDQLRWIGSHPWLHNLGPVSTLLYSDHDVGPAGISRLVAMPKVVRRIPLRLRDKIRKRAVRPAGSKWLPERLVKVKLSTGRSVIRASSKGEEVVMKLDDGTERSADHVLMGTGYNVDIRKYDFMAPDVLSKMVLFDGYPVLGSGFTSSIPGLHFIGATAARTFGPLLYFVAGTEFASRELTFHILKKRQ